MGDFLKRFSILQVFLWLLLNVFFFSYILVENPEMTLKVRDVYFGRQIWPVAVVLYSIFGQAGWTLFNWGMSLWFFYALPVYAVVQGLLGVMIPFTLDPLGVAVEPLNLFGWLILVAVVAAYNVFLVMVFPFAMKSFVLLLKGLRYAELKPDDHGKSSLLKRTGVEDEFRD